MIEGKSILAIIPARGGSKGIPRKNIRMLAGKPLIAWSIEEALKSKYIDRLVLSSEDKEIIMVAKEWGCDVPFARPKELAKDDTPTIDVLIHSVNSLREEYDYVVLLQPTSPLRNVEDINGCIEKCIFQNAPACVSVTEVETHPYWMFSLDRGGKLHGLFERKRQLIRRQDLPKVYSLNGAVYIAKKDSLIKEKTFITSRTISFVMPEERSIDIDSNFQLHISEYLLIEAQKKSHE